MSHTPPLEMEYGDIWACPTQSEKIQQQIHVPNWKIILGLVFQDSWWTHSRREGTQCCHQATGYTGVILYAKMTVYTQPLFLPVSQLRPRWQFVVSHTLQRAPSNKGLPTNVSSLSACGLWLHNFDGHINDLLYDMSNYGVHEWNGDNERFVNWFHVLYRIMSSPPRKCYYHDL